MTALGNDLDNNSPILGVVYSPTIIEATIQEVEDALQRQGGRCLSFSRVREDVDGPAPDHLVALEVEVIEVGEVQILVLIAVAVATIQMSALAHVPITERTMLLKRLQWTHLGELL